VPPGSAGLHARHRSERRRKYGFGRTETAVPFIYRNDPGSVLSGRYCSIPDISMHPTPPRSGGSPDQRQGACGSHTGSWSLVLQQDILIRGAIPIREFLLENAGGWTRRALPGVPGILPCSDTCIFCARAPPRMSPAARGSCLAGALSAHAGISPDRPAGTVHPPRCARVYFGMNLIVTKGSPNR
jgi:hypothetical protein